MKKKITILFPCIGRRVALVRSFRRACARLGHQAVIVGADTSDTSPALHCCDHQFVVKPVADPGYARQMTGIARREKVDLLIPTVDLDLQIWAEARARMARFGCNVLISRPEVVEICQDKRKTFRFLKQHGFDTPETLTGAAARARQRHHFPYFAKPWDGHASRGNVVVHNAAELEFFSRCIPNCIVQEYISGCEFTVDVFVDFHHQVRCVVPRRRLEVRAGEVSKGQTVKHPGIIEQCQKLVETLGAGPGVISIQCFLTDREEIKFIEINPRFGGGVPLSIKAGADFTRWLIQLWLGRKPRIKLDDWRDGLLMLRYDDAVWAHHGR